MESLLTYLETRSAVHAINRMETVNRTLQMETLKINTRTMQVLLISNLSLQGQTMATTTMETIMEITEIAMEQ